MADPYSTQEEQLEDLLIDYFEAWRQPSHERHREYHTRSRMDDSE